MLLNEGSNEMLSKTEMADLGRQNQQETLIVKEDRTGKSFRLAGQQFHK